MLKPFKTAAVLLACLALAGCNAASSVEPSPIIDSDFVGPGKMAFPAPGATGSIAEVVQQIEDREGAYLKVIEESRTNGMIGGAIRGALVGLLIEQSGTAVASGALLGGVIGAGIGEQFGTKIVQEHSNYTVRKDSLQRVIHAAQQDTNNTRFDLILSEGLASAALEDDEATAELVARAASSLEDFRLYAVERSVTLREVIPLYEDQQGVKNSLLEELEAQHSLLSVYEQNLHALTQRKQ